MAWPSLGARTKDWGTEVLTDSDLEGQFDLIWTYINDMMNSTTGHKHDGTTAHSQSLSSSGVTSTFGNGFTTVSAASGDYVLIASDVSDSNKTKKALVSDIVTLAAFTPSASNALAGSIVQVLNVMTQTSATGTTTIPKDNSVPQSSEGDLYMSLAVVPTSATNKLKIEVTIVLSSSANNNVLIAALYQDTTANALAAAASSIVNGGADMTTITFTYYMTAGTTSSTTFKVRAGGAGAGTTTFNGFAGGQAFNGVCGSSITISEIKV